MLLKNILGGSRKQLSIILGDSTNLQEVLTPLAAFLRGLLTQKKKTGEPRTQLSILLGDFTEVWYETHHPINTSIGCVKLKDPL